MVSLYIALQIFYFDFSYINIIVIALLSTKIYFILFYCFQITQADTEEEAARAYDVAVMRLKGMQAVTNFDVNHYDIKAILGSPKLPIGKGASKPLKRALVKDLLQQKRENDTKNPILRLHILDSSSSNTYNHYPNPQIQYSLEQVQPQNNNNNVFNSNSNMFWNQDPEVRNYVSPSSQHSYGNQQVLHDQNPSFYCQNPSFQTHPSSFLHLVNGVGGIGSPNNSSGNISEIIINEGSPAYQPLDGNSLMVAESTNIINGGLISQQVQPSEQYQAINATPAGLEFRQGNSTTHANQHQFLHDLQRHKCSQTYPSLHDGLAVNQNVKRRNGELASSVVSGDGVSGMKDGNMNSKDVTKEVAKNGNGADLTEDSEFCTSWLDIFLMNSGPSGFGF